LPKEPIQSPDANNELIEVLNQLKESLNKPPQDQPEHDKKNDESQKQRDEEIQRIRDEEVERKKLFESIVQRHNSLVERFNQIVELKDDRIKELENEIKRVLERREIANAAVEKPQEDINHVLQEVIDKKKPIMKNYSKPTQSSIKKK
jgi:DNA repair exonuclease SbcCD ATPase subunit